MANKALLVLLWTSAIVDCLSERLYTSNMTNLIIQYTEYCGSDSVCSTRNISSDYNTNHTTANICPRCSCTQDCEMNDECCPGKSLSTCVKTKYLVSGQRFIGNDEFKMITFCPEENYLTSKNNCFVPIDETNFVQQMPVYSVITNRTYINIQCSKCHGEKEVIQWPFSFSCPFLNLNIYFYSDIGKLWNDMKRNNCTIEFSPVPGSRTIPCKKQSLIKECNITGYWDDYDADIESACKNYNTRYGLFQNVFCFLCNTGTKQRHNKDVSIERAHNQQNINQFTDRSTDESFLEPNRANSKRRFHFTDTEVQISEEYNFENWKYTASVEFLSWDVIKNVEQLSSQNSTYKTQVSEAPVNLSALYEEFVRSGGYQDWCQDNHKVNRVYPGFKSRRSCSCDQECYKTKSCCPDVAYNQRWACKPASLGSNAYIPSLFLHYYFISKCPVDYTNYDIKFKCEQMEDYDMLYIPVINVQTNETYKNHYCYLCHNQHKMAGQNSTEIKAWNMTLVCPNFMFPEFISSSKKFLQTAKLLDCLITFTTENYITSCASHSQQIIGKCNVTGIAKSVSENARIMCEDPTMSMMAKSSNYFYRNQICDLCNNEVYEAPLSKCNLFGKWTLPSTDNRSTFFRCEHGDLDTRSYPFKNMYCERCNPIRNQMMAFDYEFSRPTFSYRELFSIYRTVDKMSDISKRECSEGEYYDVYKNLCTKLYCSKGKFLEKSSCIYLITHAEKVNYNLALRASLSFVSEVPSFYSTLSDLQTLIQQEIHEGELSVTETYLYSNKSCNLQMKSENTSEEAIFYLGLSISNKNFPINRKELELHLLNLTNLSITIGGMSVSFDESVEAWFLPILIRQFEQSSNPHGCFTNSASRNTQIKLDVNKLLICTQIQLEADEYVFSEDHTSIYVATINRNYKINEFLRSENNSVRICSDSYKRIQLSMSATALETVMGSILTVVTYISTILSLLSLLLTFLVYCLLPVLRTVPGKNIMCYAFSLFIAQLLFLVRSSIDDRTLCECVGGFTHYFWISVFTCTNVCCFNMFKLFVGNSLVHGDQSADRKLFVKYCLFSYLLPALPVVINMILEYGLCKSDQFGYGGSKCFLKSHLALLFLFICPIVLQIIFNIFMFSITFHYIRNTPKVQSSQDRDDFSIFLKLFLLTGISWIFMVVDGFFNISPFTYLATIINGLQGVFLFISYVCNKKVFNMLKKKCGSQQEGHSTSNRSSTTLVTGQKGQKRSYVNSHRDKNYVTDISEI